LRRFGSLRLELFDDGRRGVLARRDRDGCGRRVGGGGAFLAGRGMSDERHSNGGRPVSIRTSLAALAAFAALVSSGGRAAAQAPMMTPPPPHIATSAVGEARLTPDRANVRVGVQTRAATAAAAARENNTRQEAIIAAIKALGIPAEQITTESYSVYPETRSDREGQKPTVTSYVVSNVVRVEVRRTEQVGPVIDAALAKGANQVHSLEFFSSNSDAGRRQALANAIEKARGDAEAMARAAGGSLGMLLELSSSDMGPRPMFRVDQLRMGVAESRATPVEPGELTVQVSVTARWQYVAAR
jgi:uncharacterized protein YggE